MPSNTSTHPLASSRTRLFCLLVLCGAVAAVLLPSLPESLLGHARDLAATRVFAGTRATEYWHTAGSQIFDAHNPVRISGLNWSGFETVNAVPGGLETKDYHAILQTIHANGFNVVRLPLSNEMVESPAVPTRIAFSSAHGPINTDLRNLDSMEILDRIVAAAGEMGLKVILDNHRSEAGSSAEESGLWYTDRYPESAWIADWKSLARHFQGNSTVIGFDLRNEPHNADKGGACWDCGGANDWHLAAERAGDAVLRINPQLLIFVEGVDAYDGEATWWGGNLAGVRQSPVHLRVSGRLVYSAHVYGPSEYQQPWFNAQTSRSSLASRWQHDWAFISESNLAPVWIGEFGTSNEESDIRSEAPGSEGQWFSALIGFLKSHPQIGWTYWGANGEDRYALLDASYSARPASQSKARALASIVSPASRGSETEMASSPQPRSWGAESRSVAITMFAGLDHVSPAAASRRPIPAQDAVIAVQPMQTALAANPTPEQRAAARVQVAQAWRTPFPKSVAVRGDSQADPNPEAAGAVDQAVAAQVRQATSEALRRGGLGGGN